MDSSNIRPSQIFINTLKQDHYEFLFSIYKKYGHIGNFSFQDLIKNNPIESIQIYQNQKKNNTINNHSIKKVDKPSDETHDKSKDNNNQCIARCWGYGTFKVKQDLEKNIYSIGSYIKYNKNQDKWIYGIQCSKKKVAGSRYCGIHLKQLQNYNYLTHGIFNELPPHQHYDKYKQKISIYIALQKQKSRH